MTAADVASAAKPCGDSISISPLPRVRMIRQPPVYVPSEIASAQQMITQSGVLAVAAMVPLATSANVNTPIVFCASFVPCAKDTSVAVPICPQRKPVLRTLPGVLEVARYASHVAAAATTPAITGAKIAGMNTFEATPCQST